MDNYLELNYESNMKNLATALEYCEEELSHDDIVNELYNDNDIKKQLCLIELKEIRNQQEANILVENLTGKAGPVRETTAFKILDLISKEEYKIFFQTEEIVRIFVKGITDINPSVSRNVTEIIKYIRKSEMLKELIINKAQKTISETDTTAKNRSYVQNKKNFNLYWNLEALISISDKIMPCEKIFNILKKTAISNDYTIREKTAKAALIFSQKNPIFKEILEMLYEDNNIYVKKYLQI